MDDVEYFGGADLLPSVGRGLPRQRRELRGLGQHGAPRQQCRGDIQQRPRQRAVPWGDHPDKRMRLVHDGQLFRRVHGTNRAHGLVGQEIGGVVDPVVDDQHPRKRISLAVSPQDLPPSSCTRSSSSSEWSLSQSRHFPIHCARPWTPNCCHPGCIPRSRAATASTSTAVATGTAPTTSPVAGHFTNTSRWASAPPALFRASASVFTAITSAACREHPV